VRAAPSCAEASTASGRRVERWGGVHREIRAAPPAVLFWLWVSPRESRPSTRRPPRRLFGGGFWPTTVALLPAPARIPSRPSPSWDRPECQLVESRAASAFLNCSRGAPVLTGERWWPSQRERRLPPDVLRPVRLPVPVLPRLGRRPRRDPGRFAGYTSSRIDAGHSLLMVFAAAPRYFCTRPDVSTHTSARAGAPGSLCLLCALAYAGSWNPYASGYSATATGTSRSGRPLSGLGLLVTRES